MTELRKTILIADDDPDLRDILHSILESAGFIVGEAENGQRALQAVREHPPDLIILDYMMPELTGLQVCEQLKQDVLLRHLPIIMLTGKSEVQDKVQGISAGADDYLVKPFEPQELLARVQMVLRRTSMDLEANPLTKLPGNLSIQQELERRIASGWQFAACYIDLNRFKAFNDHYGFQRGDGLIQQTAQLLLRVSKQLGGRDDFVGHIGGDDFILITTPDRAEQICQSVVREFDGMALPLHDAEDRARGHLLHADHDGREASIPLLSISIALVSNEVRPLKTAGHVAQIGAELKALAKRDPGSSYVKERRQTPS
ncbi:MAG: response regulator [Candidatus Omnitrophica bacterium]|nr:response regulator [Candidatus Omnitrophota bacterium]